MIAHYSTMEQQRRKGRLIASTTAKLNDKIAHKTTCGTRQGWKKPPGAPKQPLSAYNLFYQYERQRILNEPNIGTTRPPQLGFAPLTRCIADRWKVIDPTTRKHFEQLAAKDRTRYNEEKKVWTNKTKTPLPPSPIPVASTSSPIPVASTSSPILSNVHAGKILDAWSDDDDCFINHKVDAFFKTCDYDSSSSSSRSSFSSNKVVGSSKPQQFVMPHEIMYQNNMAFDEAASSPTAARDETFWHQGVAERRATSPTECMCPVPLTELSRYASLSHLAAVLGNESIDLLLGLLDC